MMRKRLTGWFVICSLMLGLMGCGRGQENETKETVSVAGSEALSDTKEEKESEYIPGQGFRPPSGSRMDRNGHIVDPEGNTYDLEGKWQVPEGGRVDAQGRIYDKNGKLMGGGATIGSVG